MLPHPLALPLATQSLSNTIPSRQNSPAVHRPRVTSNLTIDQVANTVSKPRKYHAALKSDRKNKLKYHVFPPTSLISCAIAVYCLACLRSNFFAFAFWACWRFYIHFAPCFIFESSFLTLNFGLHTYKRIEHSTQWHLKLIALRALWLS